MQKATQYDSATVPQWTPPLRVGDAPAAELVTLDGQDAVRFSAVRSSVTNSGSMCEITKTADGKGKGRGVSRAHVVGLIVVFRHPANTPCCRFRQKAQ